MKIAKTHKGCSLGVEHLRRPHFFCPYADDPNDFKDLKDFKVLKEIITGRNPRPVILFQTMPVRLPAPLLRLDTLGGVRYAHEPCFRNQFAGGLADAVGLVLDADECHFEILDEFHLMRRQTRALLLGKRRRSLFEYLERRRCILCIVVS